MFKVSDSAPRAVATFRPRRGVTKRRATVSRVHSDNFSCSWTRRSFPRRAAILLKCFDCFMCCRWTDKATRKKRKGQEGQLARAEISQSFFGSRARSSTLLFQDPLRLCVSGPDSHCKLLDLPRGHVLNFKLKRSSIGRGSHDRSAIGATVTDGMLWT